MDLTDALTETQVRAIVSDALFVDMVLDEIVWWRRTPLAWYRFRAAVQNAALTFAWAIGVAPRLADCGVCDRDGCATCEWTGQVWRRRW